MKTFWKLAVTLAVVAFVPAVQPTCVFACSCRPPSPPAAALADAAAVFAGRVTALSAPVDSGGADPVRVTFAVTRSWKGANQSTVVVNTPASSASCGVGFVKGQTYLVYAYSSEGRLETILCSRTAELATAGADLAVLGPGSVPAGATPGAPPTLPAAGEAASSANQWPSLFITGGLLLIVLGAGMLRGRRHMVASMVRVRR
jgi:hypothetical protein